MYLLNTNVVSELRKVRAARAGKYVARWADSVDTTALYLSTISIPELALGVLLIERRDPTQGSLFRTWLKRNVLPGFADRILPVDAAVALRSAMLHVPDPMPTSDALIAATALVHGKVLVTRNESGFQSTGVGLINTSE